MSTQADNPSLAELEHEMAALRSLTGREAPEPVDDDLLASLRAKVDEDVAAEVGLVAKLRALPTPQRVGLVAGVTLLFTLVSGLAMPRPDLAQYPEVRMALILGLMAALCGWALWRILRPLHLPRPSPIADRILLVLGVLAPLAFALWPMPTMAHAEHAGSFVGRAMGCLAFGSALGIPVLGLAIVLRRARVDGAAVAALAGVAAGLTANLGLQLHCPIHDPAHLVVAHASLVLLLAPAAILWRR